MPSNTDAEARKLVAKRILQRLHEGDQELGKELNPILLDYLKANRTSSETVQHLQELRDANYEPDPRPELTRSFDSAIVSLFGKRQVDLASAKKDPIATRLAENMASSQSQANTILKQAYLETQSRYSDRNEDEQGRMLEFAIKKGMYSAPSGVKKILGGVLSGLEDVRDEDIPEWVYSRYLDPQTIPDGSRPSTAQPRVDTDKQPSQVTRRTISADSPYSPSVATPRDHSPIGLSEAQQLYGQLGATASGLDAVSLRHLVKQAKILRGEK